MNYDKIIIELLSRIKALEDRVDALENGEAKNFDKPEEKNVNLTARIREYIAEMKSNAAAQGEKELILVCNDIQKVFGVSNRARSVCEAMYSCMADGDRVLFAPPSKYSTTVKIKYFI